MPDIAMCMDHACPSAARCWRHEAPSDGDMQTYGFFRRGESDARCHAFWPMEPLGDDLSPG